VAKRTKKTKSTIKAKKKRDLRKYPGLDKTLFSKIKQEYHDIDYAHKLNDNEKKWLSQFMEEDLGAQLNPDTLKSKYNRKALNKTKTQRKGCFDRNNHRNVDIYGVGRATGRLADIKAPAIESYLEEQDQESYEDYLIKKIDRSK